MHVITFLIEINSQTNRSLYSILLILIFSLSCFANSANQLISEAIDDSLSAEEQIQILKQLQNNVLVKSHSDTLGLVQYIIAHRYNYINESDSTIFYSSRAIISFEDSSYNGYRYINSYLLRGESFLKRGNHLSAEQDFYFIINYKSDDQDIISAKGYTHIRIAEIFRKTAEYESCITHLLSVINNKEFESYIDYDKACILRELSYAYYFLNNPETIELAQEYIDESTDKFRSTPEENSGYIENITLNLNHKANLSALVGDTLMALSILQKSYQINKPLKNEPIFQNLRALSLIKQMYLLNKTKKYVQSEILSKKIRESDTFLNNPNYKETHAFYLIRKIELLKETGRIKAAMSVSDELKNLLFKTSNFNNIKQFQNVLHKNLIIEGQILEFDINRKTNQLEKNKLLALQIDSLIDLHIQDLYFTSSIRNLQGNISEFYKDMIDFSFEIKNENLFWHFSEKLNNLLILRNIRIDEEEVDDQNKSSFTKNIELQISELENELFLSETINPERKKEIKQEIIKIKSELLSAYQQRASYFDDINFNISSIPQSQTKLAKDESMIKYTFGQNVLYGIHITRNIVEFKELESIETIQSNCNEWYKIISEGASDTETTQRLNVISKQLHNSLINPWSRLSPSISIVPEAELHYLNFDALQNSEGEYVIQNHSIHYMPSASFGLSYQGKSSAIGKTSMFIPDYQNSDMTALKNVELSQLEELQNVSIFAQVDATKENFINALKESDIIHYGGHAILEEKNNQFSHLMLQMDTTRSSSVITLGDLYALRTDAELVSLPSCNTATGALLAGEGISNISRGFFFAGAKSIISTLWQANDKSTNAIMNDFYKHLKTGIKKGQALRLAKLDYLSNSPEYLRHPYYWAGLTMTGHNSSFKFNKTSELKYLLLIGIALLGLILALRKFKNHETPQI